MTEEGKAQNQKKWKKKWTQAKDGMRQGCNTLDRTDLKKDSVKGKQVKKKMTY